MRAQAIIFYTTFLRAYISIAYILQLGCCWLRSHRPADEEDAEEEDGVGPRGAGAGVSLRREAKLARAVDDRHGQNAWLCVGTCRVEPAFRFAPSARVAHTTLHDA